MIPIRDKKTDITSEVSRGEFLQKRVKTLSEEAANRSIDTGTELNVIIADIAKREGFNRLQIQRMVEESNTIAYNKRYDKLRNSHDRRITFPIASLDGVVKEMGFSAPPAIVNPNLPVGGEGEGEINKAASYQIERSPIHSPHSNLDKRRQKYLEKVAAQKQKEETRQYERMKKEYDRNLFKVAHSLAMTERKYGNANEVFNTLASDVSLSKENIDGIIKKASEVAEHMVKTNRSRPGFMVTLCHNPEEKVANQLLGEYSLLKQADTEDSPKVKEIKIQTTGDVADFNELVALAKALQNQQNQLAKQPATAGSEVK